MTEITDQEYVESIVKPLVDSPDEVVTSRTVDEMGVLVTLTLNRADMGKVIGRDGRTAKSIRSLLRVFGSRSNARINLKIVEPDGGEAPASNQQEEMREVPEEKSDDKSEKATSVI